MNSVVNPMNGLWQGLSPTEQLEAARMMDRPVRARIAAEFYVEHRLTEMRINLVRLGLAANFTDAEFAPCRDAVIRGIEQADPLVSYDELFAEHFLRVLANAFGEVIPLRYRISAGRAVDPALLEHELWHHHEYACNALGATRGYRHVRDMAVSRAIAAGPVESGPGYLEYEIEVDLNPTGLGRLEPSP
jgi:hypothetical protein